MRACVCTLCFSANQMVICLIEFADVFKRCPLLATLIADVKQRASDSGGGVGRAVRMDDLIHCSGTCPPNERTGFVDIDCALCRCDKCKIVDCLKAAATSLKGCKQQVEWDGYQKEVSRKQVLTTVPAYADPIKGVEVLSADGHRLRQTSASKVKGAAKSKRRRSSRHGGDSSTENQDEVKTKKRSTAMERVRYRSTTLLFLTHLMLIVPLFAKHQFINL